MVALRHLGVGTLLCSVVHLKKRLVLWLVARSGYYIWVGCSRFYLYNRFRTSKCWCRVCSDHKLTIEPQTSTRGFRMLIFSSDYEEHSISIGQFLPSSSLYFNPLNYIPNLQYNSAPGWHLLFLLVSFFMVDCAMAANISREVVFGQPGLEPVILVWHRCMHIFFS